MKYQASTLTYFSTCPFGQQNKKINCPKKLIKITTRGSGEPVSLT
jgi:hypothetical protein